MGAPAVSVIHHEKRRATGDTRNVADVTRIHSDHGQCKPKYRLSNRTRSRPDPLTSSHPVSNCTSGTKLQPIAPANTSERVTRSVAEAVTEVPMTSAISAMRPSSLNTLAGPDSIPVFVPQVV